VKSRQVRTSNPRVRSRGVSYETRHQDAKNPVFWLIGFATLITIGQGIFGYGKVSEENLANFPPPDPYEVIGGNVAKVTIKNSSPESLRLILRGDGEEPLRLNVPSCPDCPVYVADTLEECPDTGTEETFVIEPGNYETKANFVGMTDGFRSEWSLQPGWHYSQCLTISHDSLMF